MDDLLATLPTPVEWKDAEFKKFPAMVQQAKLPLLESRMVAAVAYMLNKGYLVDREG